MTEPSSSSPLTCADPARDLLADPEVQGLLAGASRRDVQRARQVFVNRNLRLERVDVVGFDMDYTLAIYQKRSIEELSFRLTLRRMIDERGYPADLAGMVYDHRFVMRGLAVDRVAGNLLKMDRYSHVGRAYHGRAPLDPEEKRRLYRDEKIRLKDERFAWIDSLFALPEACLFAEVVEALEARGQRVDFGRLCSDIRECIDQIHADGSLKAEVRRNLPRFIQRDPELGPTLHKLRSAGKKLFLLTNSGWDYTDLLMRHQLDGCLPEYPTWRHYFDVVGVDASKPAFFAERRPFREVDTATGALLAEPDVLERGRVYAGGNLPDFERLTGIFGERILYVGDHIYGDILRSKKSSLWRTCLIIEELEEEILLTDEKAAEIERLAALELLRARLDDDVNLKKLALAGLDRRLERELPGGEARRPLEENRRREKGALEKLRRALRKATEEAAETEDRVERGFNPYWGLLFKEGTENSRFGEQVEQYACIYTSRVSNLLGYSPMQYFRSPREVMPHERRGSALLVPQVLSPLGSEGPPKGSREE